MKKINIAIYHIIELILALFICLMVFLGELDNEAGLILNQKLVFLPTIFYSLIAILCVCEYIVYKKVPIVRTILIAFAFLISFMMYFDNYNIAEYNSSLWLFSIILAIMQIVTILRNGAISSNTTKIVTNKTLPAGIYSKKQLTSQYLSFLIVIVFTVIAVVLQINDKLPIKGWLMYLLIISFGTIFVSVVAIKTNPLNKALNSINNKLSYTEFAKTIEQLKMNNLHPESINYLNILLANYSETISDSDALKYFEMCSMPNNKIYKNQYKCVQISNCIIKENYEEARRLINEIKAFKATEQVALNFERLIAIKEDKEIENIEAYFPLKNKYEFITLENCLILMQYYNSRGNMDKAKGYAQKILSYNSDFSNYINQANEILNDVA